MTALGRDGVLENHRKRHIDLSVAYFLAHLKALTLLKQNRLGIIWYTSYTNYFFCCVIFFFFLNERAAQLRFRVMLGTELEFSASGRKALCMIITLSAKPKIIFIFFAFSLGHFLNTVIK